MLPVGERRKRGEIDRDRVLAEAKITDAETIEDLTEWLDNRETMVVLHDRALLGLLAGLPSRETAIAAE